MQRSVIQLIFYEGKMKNFAVLLALCFMLQPLCMFANEEGSDLPEEHEISEIVKEPFRIKDRAFEIGLLQTKVIVSNNHFTPGQIFTDKLIIDINEFINDFKINFSLNLVPFYFTYTKGGLWGFGLSLGVDAIGMLRISENVIALDDAVRDSSHLGGAMFTEAKLSCFFTLRNLKIKINPSLFYPVMYIDDESALSYTLDSKTNDKVINIGYKLLMYTAFPFKSDDPFRLTALPGADFHLGVEYPLSKALGMQEKNGFHSFIMGLDLVNIPMVPSKMKNYMELTGQIGSDEPISLDGFDSDFFSMNDPVYGNKNKTVLRPLKTLAWIDWKPSKTTPINFISTVGFALNPIYDKPVSMEGGVKVRFAPANLFIASFGMGYHDRLWINSLEMALNLRFFELNLGIDMCSQSFVKSWQGSGLGLYLGFKFGA